jgi:hypothetical protein
MPRASCRCTR